MTEDNQQNTPRKKPQLPPETMQDKITKAIVVGFIVFGLVWTICHFYPERLGRLGHALGQITGYK